MGRACEPEADHSAQTGARPHRPAVQRYTVTTDSDHDQPIADNVLRQDFTAQAPNQRWVGYTTESRIGDQGKAYLAASADLYSRCVVGWAISAVNDRHLTIKALEMALKHRCPGTGLLHHSDRGSTYALEYYREESATPASPAV